MARRKSDAAAKPVSTQDTSAEQTATGKAATKQYTAEASDVSNLDTIMEGETLQIPGEAPVQLLENCRVAHKALRLRQKPDRGAEVLKVLPIGTPVTVDLRTWSPDGVGVWMQAQANGLEGWVDTRYLVRTEEGAF